MVAPSSFLCFDFPNTWNTVVCLHAIFFSDAGPTILFFQENAGSILNFFFCAPFVCFCMIKKQTECHVFGDKPC
jgi:hypothetical protein